MSAESLRHTVLERTNKQIIMVVLHYLERNICYAVVKKSFHLFWNVGLIYSTVWDILHMPNILIPNLFLISRLGDFKQYIHISIYFRNSKSIILSHNFYYETFNIILIHKSWETAYKILAIFHFWMEKFRRSLWFKPQHRMWGSCLREGGGRELDICFPHVCSEQHYCRDKNVNFTIYRLTRLHICQ